MSREIDRLVAEHVMGYSVYHYDKDYAKNCYYMLMDGEFSPFLVNEGERQTETEAWDDAPMFSQDIAAAWMVVEKMRQIGYSITLMGQTGTFYTVYICSWHAPDTQQARQDAPTAPLTICMAALKVVGVEVPKEEE